VVDRYDIVRMFANTNSVRAVLLLIRLPRDECRIDSATKRGASYSQSGLVLGETAMPSPWCSENPLASSSSMTTAGAA
jgi:hypothetical protein